MAEVVFVDTSAETIAGSSSLSMARASSGIVRSPAFSGQ